MIFFDLDDTLMDNIGAEAGAAKEFHRLHADIFPKSAEEFVIRWRETTEKHVRRYLSGELTFQGQRRERIKELFLHKRHIGDKEADRLFEVYLNYYERNWKLFSDVQSCLNGLSGFRLGIITNGDSYQQKLKIKQLGLSPWFSVVIISEDIGIHKPDPGIFLEACRAAGDSPSGSWHIGNDLKADAEGSIHAGLNGVWLNRNGSTPCAAVPMIHSLLELKNHIRTTTR
jgi:putative hydrolase of the HAD superfamily